MASEDFVSYSIMKYFQQEGWYILQYHPPGGQACFAVPVLGDITYPDIIAYKHNKIMVMENKGRYSQSDIEKLTKLMSDPNALRHIKEFTKTYCIQHKLPFPTVLEFFYGHGYSIDRVTESLEKINLFFVHENRTINLISCHNRPYQLVKGMIKCQIKYGMLRTIIVHNGLYMVLLYLG
ncbi:hypothetical protein N752_25110 [Desulforamulus aquiferis]|nr:hypothetical protein N752_25110 [Desulforamulus aquiferis]